MMGGVDRDMLITDCDLEAMDHFFVLKKSAVKAVKDFNLKFNDFHEQNWKLSKELLTTVTSYNILDSGPPCVYPLIQKEDLLQEMIVKIKDKTSLIHDSILSIKKILDYLHKHQKKLQKQSRALDWNIVTNPEIKGSVKHAPPSDFLDHLANIIFQYDTTITSIDQYFDALNLRQPKSYEHLMNSFKISKETFAFANEFLIRNNES